MRGRVVGKSGAQAPPDLDDPRLAEGRMQRIGRGQKFERRAHADTMILALDRGRADEEVPVRARGTM